MTSRTRCARGAWGVLVALAVMALWAASAHAQGGPGSPEAAMQMPFEQFAESKGVEAQALAAELGLPESADLSQPLGQLLKANGLQRGDVQAALGMLAAQPPATPPSPEPAQGPSDEPPTSQPKGEAPAGATQMLKLPFSQFARMKQVDAQALAEALGLPEDADLARPVGELIAGQGLGPQDIQEAMRELNPLAAEADRKDWGKIRLKFMLWVLVFLVAMVLLSTVKITKALRATMLALSAIVFGVWLGVEPNAPGTVKDAFVMYGETGAIFPPRVIAFIGFMLMSIIGNKVFCGWGCHFGTLQDFVWQLKTKKIKPPFLVSNLIRAGFFAVIALAALLGPVDILEPIDPFRIFRPVAMGAVAVAVLVLVIGVWVYRPWCTFFCPFGLVSWVGERIAFWRPRVNHNTCIDCKACERACPTHSMEGLRADRPFHQDCFACGACMGICPVSAIKWGLRPPPDKPSEDVAGQDSNSHA